MPDRTVELRIPASSAYLVLARTATAAMCARLEFSVDRLDDVRLAVAEAAALLLGDARSDADLRFTFRPREDSATLDITIEAATVHSQVPPHDTFAWTVLTALVDSVAAVVDDGSVRIHLSVSPTEPVPV